MIALGRWAHAVALGALCATSFWLSFVSLGWVLRWMQRRTLRAWFEQSTEGRGGDFEAFCAADPVLAGLDRPPEWLGWRARFRPLWDNLRIGVAAAFNVFVLTGPGAALWLFSWYDGWNNSFTKGYEQAEVGPLLGLAGTGLFMIAMCYVPMAQARQAATGDWRRFYDFREVWTLVRVRRGALAALAVAFALLGAPVMLFKTAPMVMDRSEGYATLSDAQVLEQLRFWYLVTGAFLFAAVVWLRGRAATIYADALRDAVGAGAFPVDALGPVERAAFARLGWLTPEPQAPRSLAVRALLGTGRRVASFAAYAVALLAWFAFVAQIYVSEFFNFHPIVGWLNQPLVQLPWFRYLPPGLGG